MRWSVVIVFWSDIGQLLQCLETLDQVLPVSSEVIVVDNRGEPALAAFVDRFSMLRVVGLGRNSGYGGGNNFGAHCAIGDFLFVMNPDVIVKEDIFYNLEEVLLRLPRYSAVSPLLILPDGRVNTAGNHVSYTGLTFCRGLGERDRHYGLELVPAVSGAAFAIRREDFLALGGFDEAFFMYLEDTELSLRLFAYGGACWCLQDARAIHDYHLKLTPPKLRELETNRWQMLLKHFSLRLLLCLLPGLVLAEAGSLFFAVFKGRGFLRAKVESYGCLYRLLPSIAQRRRDFLATRAVSEVIILRRLSPRVLLRQQLGDVRGRVAEMVVTPLLAVPYFITVKMLAWRRGR
ncbi:MAG: glycosyltransferase family 2 protein [Chloroflexi bacterium]|nr:glycosyltransferase family 2 protein [Chloroflexota bacterium]